MDNSIMSITDKLNDLKIAKQDIKSAIQEKGVTPTGGLSTYADAIRDIQTGGGGGTVVLPIGTKFGYSTFTNAPFFDTSGYTDMASMFSYNAYLTDVPKYNTSNVTNMSDMFRNCQKLETVLHFDTGKVLNMSRMFYYCQKLATIPQFDTSNVIYMTSMFYGCQKLETVLHFDTGNCTDFTYMFYGCHNLKSVPTIKIKGKYNGYNGAPSTTSMFEECRNLETVEFEVHSPLQYCSKMFYNCVNLKTLGMFRIYEGTSIPTDAFYNCQNLTNVGGFEDLKVGTLDLRYSPLLTYESLSNIIYNLKFSTHINPKRIILHPDAAARLTDDLINIATDKDWIIATATP